MVTYEVALINVVTTIQDYENLIILLKDTFNITRKTAKVMLMIMEYNKHPVAIRVEQRFSDEKFGVLQKLFQIQVRTDNPITYRLINKSDNKFDPIRNKLILIKNIKEILNICLIEAKEIVNMVSNNGQCFINIYEKNVDEFREYIEENYNDVLILERITNDCSKACEEIQQVSSQEILKDKDDEIQNAIDDYINIKAKCKALAFNLSEIQAKLNEVKEKYESSLIEYNSLEIVKLFKNDGISNLP